MENKRLKKQVSQSSAGKLLVLVVVQKQRVFSSVFFLVPLWKPSAHWTKTCLGV